MRQAQGSGNVYLLPATNWARLCALVPSLQCILLDATLMDGEDAYLADPSISGRPASLANLLGIIPRDYSMAHWDDRERE